MSGQMSFKQEKRKAKDMNRRRTTHVKHTNPRTSYFPRQNSVVSYIFCQHIQYSGGHSDIHSTIKSLFSDSSNRKGRLVTFYLLFKSKNNQIFEGFGISESLHVKCWCQFYLIRQHSTHKGNFKKNEFLKKKIKNWHLASVTMHQGLFQLKNLAVFQIINYMNVSQ